MQSRTAQVRVFVASSLDGFIAGENDDLAWLPTPDATGGDGGFGDFLSGVGALLMGRRTYDVVAGFDGPWPYGDRPLLVATHRPLTSTIGTVRPVNGPIDALVHQGLAEAGGRNLYLDGGEMIRAALDAGLVDLVTVTFIPAVLGRGIPLFAGASSRHRFETVRCEALPGGMIQATFRPLLR